MQRYWLRIIIGALATFGIGMLVFAGVRHGAEKVERLKDTAEPINIPLALIPFTVDGQRLGTLRGLRVVRSAPERVSRLEFRVRLNEGADSSLAGDCVLTIRDVERIDAKDTFHCAKAADTATMGLSEIGSVELRNGRVLTLVAPKGALDNFKLDVPVDADSAAIAAVKAESLAAAAESTANEAVRKALPRAKPEAGVTPQPRP